MKLKEMKNKVVRNVKGFVDDHGEFISGVIIGGTVTLIGAVVHGILNAPEVPLGKNLDVKFWSPDDPNKSMDELREIVLGDVNSWDLTSGQTVEVSEGFIITKYDTNDGTVGLDCLEEKELLTRRG